MVSITDGDALKVQTEDKQQVMTRLAEETYESLDDALKHFVFVEYFL